MVRCSGSAVAATAVGHPWSMTDLEARAQPVPDIIGQTSPCCSWASTPGSCRDRPGITSRGRATGSGRCCTKQASRHASCGRMSRTQLLELGLGITNLVARVTATAAELSDDETAGRRAPAGGARRGAAAAFGGVPGHDHVSHGVRATRRRPWGSRPAGSGVHGRGCCRTRAASTRAGHGRGSSRPMPSSDGRPSPTRRRNCHAERRAGIPRRFAHDEPSGATSRGERRHLGDAVQLRYRSARSRRGGRIELGQAGDAVGRDHREHQSGLPSPGRSRSQVAPRSGPARSSAPRQRHRAIGDPAHRAGSPRSTRNRRWRPSSVRRLPPPLSAPGAPASGSMPMTRASGHARAADHGSTVTRSQIDDRARRTRAFDQLADVHLGEVRPMMRLIGNSTSPVPMFRRDYTPFPCRGAWHRPALDRRSPRALPFHWLLFAAYPVLFLYSQNMGSWSRPRCCCRWLSRSPSRRCDAGAVRIHRCAARSSCRAS